MSVYAISPHGLRVSYDADWLKWEDPRGKISFYKGDPRKEGTYIASVPNNWVVGFRQPASIVPGKVPEVTKENALDIVMVHLNEYQSWGTGQILAELKRKLRLFDGRTKSWM